MKRLMVYFLILFWMCSMTRSNTLRSEGSYNSIDACKFEKNPSKCPHNDVLYSKNELYYALVREDGCFVVYEKEKKILKWSSCNQGQVQAAGCSPRKLTLGKKGIAKLTDCKKKVLWKTSIEESPGESPYRLIVTSKGKIIIRNKKNKRIWPPRIRMHENLIIEQGTAFYPHEDAFTNGIGVRTKTLQVTFKKPFTQPPQVSLTLRHMDVVKNKNYRFNLLVEKVTKTGFVAKLLTWGDTQIWSITASWIALQKAKTKERLSVMVDTGMNTMNPEDAQSPSGRLGHMILGAGEQSSFSFIKFKKPFPVIPQVYVAISAFNIGEEYNMRLQVNPLEITKEGFKLQFFKWADTKVNKAAASWIAFAEEPTPKNERQKLPMVFTGLATMEQKLFMQNQQGDRVVPAKIKFPNKFKTPPNVSVGLKAGDIDARTAQRVYVNPADISTEGFTVKFETNSNTIVYALEAHWIAVEQ